MNSAMRGDHVRIGQLAAKLRRSSGSPFGCRVPFRARGSKPLRPIRAYFFPNMEQADLIWHNGEFVPWEEAKVHVLSHGLHYGTGVFEGIRCYETERGPAIFRHRDHLDRLAKSAELYYLPLPYSAEEIAEATRELIRRNGLRSCYIRPLAFRGYGEMGLYARRADRGDRSPPGPGAPTSARRASSTASAPRSRAGAGSSPAGLIPHAKASGQYLNSILAKTESKPTPATRRRSCSTSAASSARARARTSSSSATARSSRRRTSPRSSTGSTASR